MIDLRDQIKEVRREIVLRERVYPYWVRRGHLKEGQAAYGLAVMREVLKTLERLEAETKQPSLF